MTTRERTIMALMAATVVFGGFTAGRSLFRRKDSGPQAACNRISELREFADAARLGVTAARPRPGEIQVLEKSLAPWAASPFAVWAPPAVTSAVARAAAPRAPVFRYTGFMRQGGVCFAILNGREYRVDDAVTPGDFVVASIGPDRVVLAAKSGERQMTVALEGSGQKKGEP